jgi:Protein of unknown function (DUF3631)
MGVMLLADCRPAFGVNDVIRSVDLVTRLSADPERPWAEYNRGGKPITQRQVARLLGPFDIISVNVRPEVGPQGKGYRRVDFEEAWEAYCPGQIASRTDSEVLIRPTVLRLMESAQVSVFASVPDAHWDASKSGNLSNNHAGWDAETHRKSESGTQGDSTTTDYPRPIRESLPSHRCNHCGGQIGFMNPFDWPNYPDGVWLHPRCEEAWHDSFKRGTRWP